MSALNSARAALESINGRRTVSRLGKSWVGEADADLIALAEAGSAIEALIAEHEGFLSHRAENINADLMRSLTVIFVDREIGERARALHEKWSESTPTDVNERAALIAVLIAAMQPGAYTWLAEKLADAAIARGFRLGARTVPVDELVEAVLIATHLPNEWEFISGRYPETARMRRDRIREAIERAMEE